MNTISCGMDFACDHIRLPVCSFSFPWNDNGEKVSFSLFSFPFRLFFLFAAGLLSTRPFYSGQIFIELF